MTPFAHQILDLTTHEGVTVSTVAEALIAKHPELSPTWVRQQVKDVLNKLSRIGRLERNRRHGQETLFARVAP